MSTYTLVFYEDFDDEGQPKASDWNFQVGDKWANKELQCYTDAIENCFIQDSKLVIRATLNEGPCKYQSARINTKGKHAWQYGKFIIRAKMPKGRGSWPALWFLGQNLSQEVRWPLCGEIDLMEFNGNQPHTIYGSLHSATYNHKIGTERTTTIHLKDPSDAFHDYGVEWTKDFISFSIDGNVYARYDKHKDDTEKEWPFDQPFYLIINLAVGGMFGGTVFDEDLPYVLEVDWIKIYQLKNPT
jgi:beta-glucanase (GH16 family)